ncbi:MAG: SAM-dependent methyltransferase [Pseudomonadota bacterium]|nr:SAM-dependent methyltransferase [Pseudomonadota bacterium]
MIATPVNLMQSGKPSKSAHRVALHRAVHQLLDEPVVFSDPFALPILGKNLAQIVEGDPYQFNDPMSRGLRAATVVRSKAAEDMLEVNLTQGVGQYLVLGAGLDTYLLRNPRANKNLRVFEVDHPATQTWKKGILQEQGLKVPDSVEFVAADLETVSLASALTSSTFRSDAPSCFSWLGVTVYLSKQAIFDVLNYVASLPKGSSITFDYRVAPALLHPIDQVIGEYAAKQFEMDGEPWQSYFHPQELQRQIAALGFRDVADFSADELNARYFQKRKDGLRFGNGFRILRAVV